ncbi:MAG: hypothetical protein P2A85_09145 [Microcoleus anatoxicus]|uniref:hypothetical protein n=1 Tax=Microcoleus anatoxicus TaxID=2705319 RepID=UPI003671AE13
MTENTTTTSKQGLPIYHWSEIASPRLKLTSVLFSEPITVTQTVHKRNQTPKVTKAHPALVVYDASYVKHKLLEVVAPLIAEQLIDRENGFDLEPFQKGFPEQQEILFDEVYPKLSFSLMTLIADATKAYVECAVKSDEIGITLTPNASTIVKSFKLVQELAYIDGSDTQKSDTQKSENSFDNNDSDNDL